MRDRSLIESLEHRRLLAGVTLITHGWNGSTDGWIDAMADRIVERVGDVGSVAEYKLSITGTTGSPNTATLTRISPIDWSAAESGQAIIKLDWSTLAGGLFPSQATPTGTVAAFATNWLLNNAIGGVSFASVPIHMIGHSRGASVINAMARDLGQAGIVVHHQTTLDPHPVDGIRDPLGLNFGDEAMNLPANVVFSDNYWRTDGDTSFDFTGEPVTGALNYQLSESLMATGGYSNEHSDVHLWYFGTIDLRPTANNSDYTVPPNWHTAPNPGPRHALGWNYSRSARDDGEPSQYGSNFGGGASRSAVALTTPNPRANLVQLSLAGGLVAPGEPMQLDYRYVDPAGGATLQFWLDDNANPFDGGEMLLGQSITPSSGAWPVSATAVTSIQLPGGLPAGVYHLHGKAIDTLGRARWLSLAQPLVVTQAGEAERIDAAFRDHLGTARWSDPGNWLPTRVPTPGQRAMVDRAITVSAGDVMPDVRLAAGAAMTWSDGTLAGHLGISAGAVLTLSGGVTPLQGAAGSMNVDGEARFGERRAVVDDLRMNPSAVMRVRVGAAGNVGGATVSTADLAGTLDVAFAVVPAAGTRFDVIVGAASGRFDAVLDDLPSSRVAVPVYAADRVQLLATVLGDMNGDGVVNNLDIAPFVQGLTSPQSFVSTFGYSPQQIGDINGDGAFNNLDIAPFVALLTGSRSSPRGSFAPPPVMPTRTPAFGGRALVEIASAGVDEGDSPGMNYFARVGVIGGIDSLAR